MDQLGNIVNVDVVLAEQGVIEGNGNAAVGILDVEDDRVAADFTPVAYSAESVVAAGHEPSEIDGADFEILRDRYRLFVDRGGKHAGDDQLLVGFEEVRRIGLVIDGAERLRQLGRR